MSYEYSAANGRFEIPNPYRIENIALLIGAGIAGAVGLLLLISHREAIGIGDFAGIKAILIGFVLLVIALTSLARALMQLRYYFGRGRPRNIYGAGERSTADTRGSRTGGRDARTCHRAACAPLQQ